MEYTRLVWVIPVLLNLLLSLIALSLILWTNRNRTNIFYWIIAIALTTYLAAFVTGWIVFYGGQMGEQ